MLNIIIILIFCIFKLIFKYVFINKIIDLSSMRTWLDQ